MIALILTIALLVALPIFVEARRNPRANILVETKNELAQAIRIVGNEYRLRIRRSVREPLEELLKLVFVCAALTVIFWVAKLALWLAQIRWS